MVNMTAPEGPDNADVDSAPPKPAALIESLRAFGYDSQTAIADLIDNSIAAQAKNIWIDFVWNGAASSVSIRDDGKGMSERALVDAMAKLRALMESAPGVASVHDLYVWTLTSGRYVLTAHVVTNALAPSTLLETLSEELREQFKIFHTTLQLEDESCGDLHAALHDDSAQEVPHAEGDHGDHEH